MLEYIKATYPTLQVVAGNGESGLALRVRVHLRLHAFSGDDGSSAAPDRGGRRRAARRHGQRLDLHHPGGCVSSVCLFVQMMQIGYAQ